MPPGFIPSVQTTAHRRIPVQVITGHRIQNYEWKHGSGKMELSADEQGALRFLYPVCSDSGETDEGFETGSTEIVYTDDIDETDIVYTEEIDDAWIIETEEADDGIF